MKLVYCVCLVTVFLILSEGNAGTSALSTTTTRTSTSTSTRTTTAPPEAPTEAPNTKPTTRTTTTTTTKPTTTRTTTTTTTTKPTTRPYTTTTGHAVNLKGQMVTLSRNEYSDSGVTFYPPYYQSVPAEGRVEYLKSTTTTTTTTTTTATTRYRTTTTAPSTRGVSVCLRFLTDSSSLKLFTLSPGSPMALYLSLNDQWYTLGRDDYYSQVSLKTSAFLWNFVQTPPWTSVCVILDSLKNVVQVFEGGAMSIRKMPRSRMVWSGEPVLEMSGFDGQVTDLEVWDYPLLYSEVFGYMQNYRSSGTVLTWSNIAYRLRGNILMEATYDQQMRQPISSSEGEEPPIKSWQGWDLRLKYRKRFRGRRQMF